MPTVKIFWTTTWQAGFRFSLPSLRFSNLIWTVPFFQHQTMFVHNHSAPLKKSFTLKCAETVSTEFLTLYCWSAIDIIAHLFNLLLIVFWFLLCIFIIASSAGADFLLNTAEELEILAASSAFFLSFNIFEISNYFSRFDSTSEDGLYRDVRYDVENVRYDVENVN